MKRSDKKRRWRPGFLIGAAPALVLGALMLAGCGGSSGGGSTETSTTTASTGGGENSNGMFSMTEEERACLKEKGVELPEFNGSEGGPPAGANGEPPEGFEPPEGAVPAGGFSTEMCEEQKQAFEECGVEMPEFKGPGGAGGPNVNSAAFKKQVKEYVACVRAHGYELAEPDFSGEGPIFERSESESSAFKKASAKCSNLLGGPQGSQSG